MSDNVRRTIVIGAVMVAVGLWLSGCKAASAGVTIATPTAMVTATPWATPTTAPILVHVAGAVRQPGVYALAPEARVIDAVEAAGGLTAEADSERINLADHLQDAMRLDIPTKGQEPGLAPTPIPARRADAAGQTAKGLININMATQAELEALPHIGEALAGRIIAYREAHGPFQRVEDLQQVSGIGDTIYADLQPLICIE